MYREEKKNHSKNYFIKISNEIGFSIYSGASILGVGHRDLPRFWAGGPIQREANFKDLDEQYGGRTITPWIITAGQSTLGQAHYAGASTNLNKWFVD